MNNLLDILFRDAIGYDNLSRFGVDIQPKYPPHNIVKNGDTYSIRLAVAGFTKHDLSVHVEDNHLVIRGTQKKTEFPEGAEILYRGIAERDFERTWRLGEYVEVTNVELADGMLIVELERKLPTEKKAKTFAIQ